MDETYGTVQRAKWAEHGASGGRVDTSFASEVQNEQDPTENTKMVV